MALSKEELKIEENKLSETLSVINDQIEHIKFFNRIFFIKEQILSEFFLFFPGIFVTSKSRIK